MMRSCALIIGHSLRQNFRQKTATIISAGIMLMCAAAIDATFCILLIAPTATAASRDRASRVTYLSIILYCNCLLGPGVNLNAFAFPTLTREKTRGNLEALLATPLSIRSIWAAKSIAVYLPGLVMGLATTLIALFTINGIVQLDRPGVLLPPWTAVGVFLATPLMYLCISLLSHLVGLTGKPASANVIVQLFLPLIITLTINLMLRNILEPGLLLTLMNLGIAVALALIILFLQPRLTRERIILSQ